MRKKTSKAVFAALIIVILLSAGLVVFSNMRRAVFLNEGNTVIADFCITMAIFGFGTAILSSVFTILLLKRDKKIEYLQKFFLK